MTVPKRNITRTAAEVKGPIRCHKCQLKCQNAKEYLSHTCKSAGLSITAQRLSQGEAVLVGNVQ